MPILALKMIRKQLFIFGVKHELPLALQCSELDFGFVPHPQHMPVTAIPESCLCPGPCSRDGNCSAALRKPCLTLTRGMNVPWYKQFAKGGC